MSSDIDRDATRRVVAAITVVAMALFWLVATSWRPWDLFERGGFSADFYDEQARVFLRGRLAVDPAVAGPEGFLIDGRTYLYYGPFLAIVRMPLMLFGDLFVGRLVRVSMLIALGVLIRWSARLVVLARAAVRPADDRANDGWAIGVFVGAVAFSPALFAAGWTSVYHETELWALTLAVVSAVSVLEWAATEFTDLRRLLWAGAAALAATLTRAPIGFGVALAVGVCGLVLVWRHRRSQRRNIGLVATGLGLLPLVAHVLVNLAKFGTALSVPADRQVLSITDPERAAWFAGNANSFFSMRFLPTTMAHYWRPDTIRFERLVPGIRYGPLAEDYGSYPVETVTTASSLTVSATLLLVLACVGVVWLVRRRARAWLVVVAATACGAIPTFLIGFIANRYLIDMLPPLIVAAAVGAWLLPVDDRWWRVAAAVLLAWGAWVNTALATWTLELKSPGFTELRYGIDEAVFGGGHDSLITLDPDAPVPRDAVVGVLDDCTGVYIAEQGRWVALDRANGIRRISGDLGDGPAVLAIGATWQLAVQPTADGLTVVLTDDAGDGDFARPVGGGPLTYEIIVDDVAGEYFARVGGDGFFLAPDVVSGRADLRPDSSAPPPTSDLCRALTD